MFKSGQGKLMAIYVPTKNSIFFSPSKPLFEWYTKLFLQIVFSFISTKTNKGELNKLFYI